MSLVDGMFTITTIHQFENTSHFSPCHYCPWIRVSPPLFPTSVDHHEFNNYEGGSKGGNANGEKNKRFCLCARASSRENPIHTLLLGFVAGPGWDEKSWHGSRKIKKSNRIFRVPALEHFFSLRACARKPFGSTHSSTFAFSKTFPPVPFGDETKFVGTPPLGLGERPTTSTSTKTTTTTPTPTPTQSRTKLRGALSCH